MEPRIMEGEIVIAENSRLTIKVYELEQRIHNNQIHAANENLTQLNDALKIVLRDAEDMRDHYKAANLKEFEEFISNYIFGLFDNIGTLFRFDNQYITNIKVFVSDFCNPLCESH
ncbi:28821_t:CDS:2 [Racocetra persica]|uniref:28821_t:CDS:1 n=1 Tax=Racocetra persica TaxID=160502 RepID=A0ACA9MHY1_9GLOM|nr:28821_t:CDS:2 [Racocetra persica]